MKTRPCGECGTPGPWSAMRCIACATKDPAKETLAVLVSPTLAYRVAEWLKLVAMAIGLSAILLVGTAVVGRIGNYLLGDWFGNILFLLACIVCLLVLATTVHMLPDIWRNEEFGEVSNWRASRHAISTYDAATLEEPPEMVTTFHDASIPLHDVKRVAVKQSWVGRMLGYGDVLFYETPGGKPALVFGGISEPMEVARRIEELAARAPALPKPPAAPAGAPKPSPSWPDRASGALETMAGAAIPIVIVGGLMYAGWWWWSQHQLTMAPGESREIHMKGLGAVATRPVHWTSQDTYDLGMRIGAPPGVEVTFLSASVTPSELGEHQGTQIGIDYKIRIQVAQDARPGDVEIHLQFEHPKLGPPYMPSPPVEKFRLKIK